MYKTLSPFFQYTNLIKKNFSKIPSDAYTEYMYNLWIKDPKKVHEAWNIFFQKNKSLQTDVRKQYARQSIQTTNQIIDTQQNTEVDEAYTTKSIVPKESYIHQEYVNEADKTSTTQSDNIKVQDHLDDHTYLYLMISRYQEFGHFISNIDPLNLDNQELRKKYKKQTQESINIYKELIGSMDKELKLPHTTFIGGDRSVLKFKEIIERLEAIYCNTIGVQSKHTNQLVQKVWLQHRLEYPRQKVTPLEKVIAFKRLIKTTRFESFLVNKFQDTMPAELNNCLSGCDSLIPALGQIIDTSTTMGVNRIIIGMEYRGRLTVIAHILKKPLHLIFTLFNENYGESFSVGTSEKYLNLTSQRNVRVALAANPRHKESIGPIIIGKTRGQMFNRRDKEGKAFLPIIIHESGAIAGQGVCFETFSFSNYPAYSVYGAIHMVINDQLGVSSHSTLTQFTSYCTGIGKVPKAPIFHVNADDVTNIIYVSKIAAEYRAKFHADILLDIVGYRRTGGKILPNPVETEPYIYTKIKETPTVMDRFYTEVVKTEKLMTDTEYEAFVQEYDKTLEAGFTKGLVQKLDDKYWIGTPWNGFFQGKNRLELGSTGIREITVEQIGTTISKLPPHYVLHPGVVFALRTRQDLMNSRKINWIMAEAMAIGSLLKDGIHVRLSGQDVERGTFAHRHHVLHHQKADKAQYKALNKLYGDQAGYVVCNSPTTQYAVLGFELGYSYTSPNILVIWEAQYGALTNFAQVLMDQYIACAEELWINQSGIVILLPHGMEGEFIEPSNARPERFLSLCNDDPENIPTNFEDKLFAIKQLIECNIIIANCTTAANYFHILRRQILMSFRKPLILFTPKALINTSVLNSPFNDILEGTQFKRIIPDSSIPIENIEKVKKLIFCWGRVYFDLIEERKSRKLDDQIAITRIEQIAPFPYDLIKMELEKYKHLKTITWVQEEHRNHGPWYFVEPRFQFLGVENLEYIGRLSNAVPATAYISRHFKERDAFLLAAMKI